MLKGVTVSATVSVWLYLPVNHNENILSVMSWRAEPIVMGVQI